MPEGETFNINQPTHVLVNFATSTDRDSQLVYIKEYTCDKEFSEHVQVRIRIVWQKGIYPDPAGYFRVFIIDKTRGKKEIHNQPTEEDAYYVIEGDFLIIYTKHFSALKIDQNGELMLSSDGCYNFMNFGVKLYYKQISILNMHKLEMFLRIVDVNAGSNSKQKSQNEYEKNSERDLSEFKHVDLSAKDPPPDGLPFKLNNTFEYIMLSNPTSWVCIQPNEKQVSALE